MQQDVNSIPDGQLFMLAHLANVCHLDLMTAQTSDICGNTPSVFRAGDLHDAHTKWILKNIQNDHPIDNHTSIYSVKPTHKHKKH